MNLHNGMVYRLVCRIICCAINATLLSLFQLPGIPAAHVMAPAVGEVTRLEGYGQLLDAGHVGRTHVAGELLLDVHSTDETVVAAVGRLEERQQHRLGRRLLAIGLVVALRNQGTVLRPTFGNSANMIHSFH